MKKILKSKEGIILLLIIFISAIITLKNPDFLTTENLLTLFKINSVVATMAIGMTLAILTGGIDVSVGGNIAVSAMIVGYLSKMAPNLNIFFLILIGFAIGASIGSINGMLISFFNFPPIVVTLGVLSILNGLLMYFSKGNWVNNLPVHYMEFGNIKILGLPIQILLFLFVAIVIHIFLKYTIIGRGIYALGGDENSAQRIGFNTKKIKFIVYMLLGGIVGISSVIHTSIVKQVDPTAYSGIELIVIAAVVLGGVNINGGYGTVLGTTLGIILLSIINNGMIIMHIPVFWQKIATALIILFAVSIDIIQRKIKEKNTYKVDIV
ncbi:ABC transporter permease [Cetobacterium sp. 2A]|uniref:ABC transporter permease n=1 Tax=unclassified Cetobacterium TaxID=2630983 RepID=UPI00163C8946|nr:ABC transporter permease [Cetobacterium sp. 2A]MBC2857293.1 ABC transporter permease [Cetobacterium sp. 2A]